MAQNCPTPAHICGLVVGEGCFYVESAADPKYRLGWRIRPAFCIEMRYDDRAALEAVKKSLGCGEIYELDFGRYRGYEARGWHPHVKYRVSRITDLHERVVPFFREHRLFGRKAEALEIFASIVEILYRKEHRTRRGLEGARQLAASLKNHNARSASVVE